MKFQSAMMSVGNALIAIVVFISTMYNHMYYYEGNKSIFFALMFLIVIANGVLVIANYKRNRAVMVLDGIAAVLWIMVVALGMTASVDKDLNSNLLIIKVLLGLIVVIAIAAGVFVPKTKKATKRNAINLEVEREREEQEEAKSIDEAFKVKTMDKKEEAVGIANLVSKIVIPVLWALFAGALIIQIIEPGKTYAQDKEVLLKGLKEIGEYDQKKSYIYQSAENEFKFLDENGTYLNRINVETLSNFDDNYVWKFNYPDQNHVVEVFIAKLKDKVQIINTEGQKVFEIEKRYPGEAYLSICYLMKQAIESGDVPSTASINFSEDKTRIEGANVETEAKSEQEYGFKTKINAYYRVNETPELKEFEENETYKYMYFKNDNLSDNILQIAITKENSGTVPFLEKYLKHKETVFNITDAHKDAIQEFYRFKKEYKLIHLATKANRKVDAQDIFYDNFTIDGEEKEVIYAYSDGSIPFMNSEYNSFVTTDGRILGMLKTTGSDASVFALVDSTNVIATRIDTQLSILYSKETVMNEGTFKETRHEGKKMVDLGMCYYLAPIDQTDTNRECILQTKGYSNEKGIARSESAQVDFVGPILLSLYNKNSNRYEIYYYTRGDIILLFNQIANPKMYAVGMETALPGGYSPYDLIGIYDK